MTDNQVDTMNSARNNNSERPPGTVDNICDCNDHCVHACNAASPANEIVLDVFHTIIGHLYVYH